MKLEDIDLPDGYTIVVSERRGFVKLRKKTVGPFYKVLWNLHGLHSPESREYAVRRATKHAWLRENPTLDFEDDNEW